MTKKDKLIKKFLSSPKDLTWDELVKFLKVYGYEEENTGKTVGSARRFINSKKHLISIHKPHPENIVKSYVIKKVINALNIK